MATPTFDPVHFTIPSDLRDPNLPEKLRGELSGILNWALEGCQRWQTTRLNPPAVIVDAVAEYKEEMDFLGQWLSGLCEVGADFTISASDAYVRDWARVFGLNAWSNPVFGRKLKERFHARRKADGIHYCGFRTARHSTPRQVPIQKAKPILAPIPAASLTVQEAVAEAIARAACNPSAGPCRVV